MARKPQRSGAQHPTDLVPPSSDDHVSEPTLQTHLWLTPEDIALLDSWVLQLRYNGWRRASRSACVRAMVRMLQAGSIDLQNVTNEQEFAEAIHAGLNEPKQREEG